MSKTITNVTDVSITHVKEWKQVLADAEAGLTQAAARARALRRVIRTVREKIAAGEPFPGKKR